MKNRTVERLLRPIAWIRNRLRTRTDTEHVMSMNRSVFCILLSTYLLMSEEHSTVLGVSILTIGLLISSSIFIHILVSPKPNSVRRALALTADMSTICLVLHIGGEEASIFYPLILWTIIGNGLRFGISSLRLATVAGLVGFGVVVMTTPFWLENVSLTFGLIIGQIILPLYAGALIRSLTKAKLQAEAANQAKNLFLASVSHELRTPLQAIIGTGDLLGRTRLTHDQADMSRTIMDASGALLGMIDDLLQFSKIEAGSLTTTEIEFETLTLLEEVASVMRPAFVKKGLRSAFHITPRTPLKLSADQRHIREILLNLSANALKFTDQGGVLLTIDTDIREGALPHLVFEIVDTGIGIPQEAHERIFERFTQADRTISDRFGGTGLGLALCKKLVTELGGEIGVHSEPGTGSTFWFHVPFNPVTGTHSSHLRSKQPLTVVLPNDQAKGRLYHHLRDRDQDVEWVTPGVTPVAGVLDTAFSKGRCAVMATPSTPPAIQELDLAVRRLERGRALPLVLIDDTAPLVSDVDLRWLAPVRLSKKFSDEELEAALSIAGLLNGNRPSVMTAPVPAAEAPHSACHVLVADDNRTNQLVLTKILESGGHTVQVVSDGEEVLDALDRVQFDLVIIDVNMPNMDGIEATKLQRVAELGLQRIPIFGLTADATPELAKRCKDAGMDDCITKPVTANRLLELVGRVGKAERRTGRVETSDRIQVRYEGRETAILDPRYLADLEKVGGPHFVFEVAGEFTRDAGVLIKSMIGALDEGDVGKFQFNAHALGSSAANVGAVRLSKLGLYLEHMGASKLTAEGRDRVRDLVHELDEFVKALAERTSDSGPGKQ